MAKRRKDWMPVVLMLLSLLLLLISQAIWLHRTFRSEQVQFQKRAGELLDISVRELSDSMTVKRLREEVGIEGEGRIRLKVTNEMSDSSLDYSSRIFSQSRKIHPAMIPTDSFHPLHLDTGHVQAIVITQFDASDTVWSKTSMAQDAHEPDLATLFSMADRSPLGMRVLMGLTHDSISIDSLSLIFARHLQQENLVLDFTLLPAEQQLISSRPVLSTSEVRLSILGPQSFKAHFPGYRSFLLGRMWEEILFSCLLLGVISLAFAFIYRSLLKQHRLSVMKNDLLSNITHELKTPISSVSVALEAIRDFGVLNKPELAKEYLDISRDELKRLSLLVDRVLRLTTFEQKEPDLHLEPLDMAKVSDTILQSMKVQFDQYDAKSKLEFSGTDFSMEGDRIHLSSVLFNLVDNALKYRNGGQAIVQVRLEECDTEIKIRVKDNGVGIPAAYQNKIFDKFFRVPQGNVHNIKGYGLGLSYVSAVVAKHGGKIHLESELGKGSEFFLTFPKKQS